MDNKKIAEFIRNKRKEKKMTQLELADKLYVTEKAISRWETGRGTPDVSLLLPLSEILDVSVSDILNGEIKTKSNDEVKDIIKYVEINRKGRFNIPLLLSVLCYIVSIFIFLFYLKFDYTNYDSWGLSSYEYIIRLLMVVGSSIFFIASFIVLY
jgi:transcriptional regulator with XRE-family HTH domain